MKQFFFSLLSLTLSIIASSCNVIPTLLGCHATSYWPAGLAAASLGGRCPSPTLPCVHVVVSLQDHSQAVISRCELTPSLRILVSTPPFPPPCNVHCVLSPPPYTLYLERPEDFLGRSSRVFLAKSEDAFGTDLVTFMVSLSSHKALPSPPDPLRFSSESRRRFYFVWKQYVSCCQRCIGERRA